MEYQKERMTVISDEMSRVKQITRFMKPPDHLFHEIQLTEINVSIGSLNILVDEELTLAHGNRYGLIGCNGMGETTFMKHMNSNPRRELNDLLLRRAGCISVGALCSGLSHRLRNRYRENGVTCENEGDRGES